MRWVGLVRNVMQGREGLHRQVLLDLAVGAGAAHVRTHLTTGNLTFTADSDAVAGIAERLQVALAGVIGREELVVVRPVQWVRDLVDDDPFRAYDPAQWRLEVGLLGAEAAPATGELGDLATTVVVRRHARELLTARPLVGSVGPHAGPLLQRLAGSPATARAWSTLVRLAGDPP